MIPSTAAMTLLSFVAVVAIAAAADRTEEEPADLTQARASYQRDVEFATRPLRDRYLQTLERIKKSLTFKGDLAGALKVQDEMESLGSGAGLARLAGDWVCQFANGAIHHYTIEADGTAFWTDRSPKKKLKIALRGKDYFMEFPDDNILERITMNGNELEIEHYTPRSTYPQGAPATRGSGKRVAHKK